MEKVDRVLRVAPNPGGEIGLYFFYGLHNIDIISEVTSLVERVDGLKNFCLQGFGVLDSKTRSEPDSVMWSHESDVQRQQVFSDVICHKGIRLIDSRQVVEVSQLSELSRHIRVIQYMRFLSRKVYQTFLDPQS